MTAPPPAARATGLLMLAFALAVNVPYTLLQANFEYDDILRQPPAYVLAKLHEGGAGLILTWFAFALCALLFAPVAAVLPRLLAAGPSPWWRAAAALGVASAVLQCVGLLRWVFVVPVLAAAHADPAASAMTREAVIMVYRAVHQYGGVALGEQMGQLLLAAWTLAVGLAILRGHAVPRWLAWPGLATVPLWLLAQTELLATTIPGLPVIAAAPAAFILWEVWILMLGGVLAFRRAS
jgi:hypothetical protein